MNYKFKMRQRVTALCMAAMMCCGMLPYGALAEDSARPVVVATPEQAATQEAKSESDANSTATPETADESSDENAPQQEPETEGDTGGSDELYEIWQKIYPSLTQEPTGYYLDSYGLPVLVGETKISIEGWGNEDYSSVSDDSFQQVALDAALLDADSTTAAFPHIDGENYAIVPISMQVMYPANGSSADITLPDNVELLGYSFTSGDLTPATEEERQSQLHYDFSEVSASVAGIYVKASEDFSVTFAGQGSTWLGDPLPARPARHQLQPLARARRIEKRQHDRPDVAISRRHGRRKFRRRCRRRHRRNHHRLRQSPRPCRPAGRPRRGRTGRRRRVSGCRREFHRLL